MVPADCFGGRPARHLAQRAVEPCYLKMAIQNHDAVRTLLQYGVQTLLLLIDLIIKPGVADGNGCLLGKAAQKIWCVIAEVVTPRLKDVD